MLTNIALNYNANGKTREKAETDSIFYRYKAKHVATIALDMCETYEENLLDLCNLIAQLSAEN